MNATIVMRETRRAIVLFNLDAQSFPSKVYAQTDIH